MSDAPKAKPAAKTEGKPAAEKAAAKAPAKAAAKGAAKGAAAKAAKPVAEKRTEGPRKKSKTPLVPRPPNPQALINKKLWEERAAHNKAAGAKRVTEQKKKAERRKAVREAKKKGLPKPKLPKVKKSIRNKERKAKLAAKGKTVADPKVAHQRFFLQLTPLNQWFQDRFGFIFSEFIGKAREKALRARNVKVVVHQPGLALNGRVGKLIYYTGKHRGFVKIGHTVFKIPFHFLFRRKVYHTEIRKRLFVNRQNRRRADHASKLRALKKGADAAKAGAKTAAPAAFKEVAYKELTPRGKRAPKKDRKNKTKPVPKTKKADGLDALPAKPFPNVGNAVKNNKGLLVHKAIQKEKKASEDAKKAGKKSEKKVDKKARNARRRRGQKGKPRPKTAAAAAAPAGNAAATKAAAPAAKPAAKPAAAARKA